MADSKRILIIATSHADLGETGKKTGFHYEELATPYFAFTDAGYRVDFASPEGGMIPYDPNSYAETEADRPASVNRFVADMDALTKVQVTKRIEHVNAEDYEAIYLPGGHGTMWDLPENERLGQLIVDAMERDIPVAAVCHGPAGLIAAIYADGTPVVKGRKVNSFTDAEEHAVELETVVPFLLEAKLRELGAEFEGGENFTPKVVVDGNLITGQNPMSAAPLADAVLTAIEARRKKAA
tara:strand:+ start:10173 stop:10889 length:717 start_codon:yes stop_codon:yes gene_type:complete